MNRRDPSKPPRPGMRWSERFGMWMDRDVRSPQRRIQDERILNSIQKDRKRIQSALRRAKRPGAKTLDDTAGRVARSVLRSLIRARENAGLSQSEVARRMGVPQPVVVRLEAGTHSPTLATLSRYATAVGVKLVIRQPA